MAEFISDATPCEQLMSQKLRVHAGQKMCPAATQYGGVVQQHNSALDTSYYCQFNPGSDLCRGRNPAAVGQYNNSTAAPHNAQAPGAVHTVRNSAITHQNKSYRSVEAARQASAKRWDRHNRALCDRLAQTISERDDGFY